MKKYRHAAWALGPVLLSLFLSGCGGSGVSMTHQQAVDRANHLVNEVVSSLHPRPRLELSPSLTGDTGCENALGEISKVTTGNTYQLQGISVSDNAAVARQVLAYWQRGGYQVTDSRGVGTEQPEIDVQTPDGFTMALYTGGDGVLYIGATSPCVDPAPGGTPTAG